MNRIIQKTSASKTPDATGAGNSWWICVFLVLAVFTAYWPVTGYKFTYFDDQLYVWQNPQVSAGLTCPGFVWAFTKFYSSNWHPLTWLSHMLDVQLYGMNAGGHHATNVLFHAANTALLFLWLKRLTGNPWRSALVAALFGLHPLNVESVAWVSERKNVLSTFFLLLSLSAYTRYAGQSNPDSAGRDQKWRWYALALGWFALGLMSKPMLVTLPFLLLLLDFWPLRRFPLQPLRARPSIASAPSGTFMRLLWEKVPFLVLSAGACVVTFFAQQSGKAVIALNDIPFDLRVQNALIAYVLYLKKMFWPDSLAPFYPYSGINADTTIAAVFALLLISWGVFFLRRQRPYLVVGWLWYLGTLVPVIGLLQVGSQSMADRYAYVPLIGLFIAIIWLMAEIKIKWRYRRTILVALSAAALVACRQSTAAQVRFWQNGETLARHSLAVTPDNAMMQIVLGNTLMEQGKFKEAGVHFADVVKILPDNLAARGDLALALVAQGRFDEAIDSCRAALKIKPDEARPHYLLGNVFSEQGKFAEGIAEYKTALGIDPDYMLAMNDLAWQLATAPDPRFRDGSEAVRLAENACRLSNYRETLFVGTLAAAYAEAGRFDDAVTAAQKAITLAAAEKRTALLKRNRELLELYLNKRAYHEPAVQVHAP